MLIVVFGLPGVGKTHVGNILRDEFDFFVYNADRSLPRDMRQTLFQKKIISEDMRERFTKNIIRTIEKLIKQKTNLVVIQTFSKEKHRKQFLQKFSDAHFFLIKTKDEVREARYLNRVYFNLGLSYLQHMSRLFEAPTISHIVITNDEDGKQQILLQLRQLPFLTKVE